MGDALTLLPGAVLAARDMGDCCHCGEPIERGTYYSRYRTARGGIVAGHANCLPPLPEESDFQDEWAAEAKRLEQ